MVMGLAAAAVLASRRWSTGSTGSRGRPGCRRLGPPLASCEVRLWGPGGTRGRSPEVLAAEAEKSRLSQAWRSPTDDIEDFIRQGPLYQRLLLICPAPAIAEWMDKAQAIAEQLRVGTILPQEMEEQMSKRIYHLYLPLYFWMRHQALERRSSRSHGGAVVFGISAPQGFGKTTTMQLLEALFVADGFNFQAVSIDDFYLPATWQEEVANVYSDNALLQSRGNAGTHDIRLGSETLKALKSAEEGEVLVPRFDKSALNGRGDQVPKHRWTPVALPCDVVVLEGWMVGFKAEENSQAVAAVNRDLPLVNEKLKKYQAWNDLIDCFCVFAMEEIDQVYTWRSQAEEAMKRSGRDGMSPSEVKDFVDRYMPAYIAYRPGLYAAASHGGVNGKPTWLCHVSRDRLPIY